MNSYLEAESFFEKNTKATLERIGIRASDQALADYCTHTLASIKWHFISYGDPTLQGIMAVRPLKWDSTIYGINIGSIGLISLVPNTLEDQKREIYFNLIEKSKQDITRDGFDLLVYRLPVTELICIQALERAGFFIADVQCPLVCRSLEDIRCFTSPKLTTTVRAARPDDFFEVARFGKSAFGRSHLYADSRLPVDLSDRLHEEWLKNDIVKGRAKFTLVAEINGEVGGFVSTLWDDAQQQIFGIGHGHIDLIAVQSKFQGQGVGRLLLSKAVEQLRREGANLVTVSTQATNLNAIKLYQQSGFSLSGFELTLHGWFR